MRAGRRFLPSLGLLGMFGLTTAVAVAGTSWGHAIKVPWFAGLNRGGMANLLSISCTTARSCAAGGYYRDGASHGQAFVVDKKNGVWRKAVEVPGSAALNRGGGASVASISCATARSCAAGGHFSDRAGHVQAFVASKSNGVWRKAVEVPGSAALNRGGSATVYSISCATAGSCAAGGSYRDGAGHTQAFVVNEKNGVWGKARKVPGLAALNVTGNAEVYSISCATARSCSAGGFYSAGLGAGRGFVVNEKNGIWHKAVEMPGAASLDLGSTSAVESISCTTALSCAAGGFASDGSGHDQAFVVNETNGIWRTPIEVPGSADLNVGGAAAAISISCATATSCAVGGDYSVAQGYTQAFVANETNGVWGTAVEVPGSAALNVGLIASALSVSCATATSCTAGGVYTDASIHSRAFVVSETNGVWGTAIEVPGSAALDQGGFAAVNWISCATANSCGVGGQYVDKSGRFQAFVTAP